MFKLCNVRWNYLMCYIIEYCGTHSILYLCLNLCYMKFLLKCLYKYVKYYDILLFQYFHTACYIEEYIACYVESRNDMLYILNMQQKMYFMVHEGSAECVSRTDSVRSVLHKSESVSSLSSWFTQVTRLQVGIPSQSPWATTNIVVEHTTVQD